MKTKKPRWSELPNNDLCLVDGDGMILARVTVNALTLIYKYQDKEFIDARSAMKHVEKEKFSEVE